MSSYGASFGACDVCPTILTPHVQGRFAELLHMVNLSLLQASSVRTIEEGEWKNAFLFVCTAQIL